MTIGHFANSQAGFRAWPKVRQSLGWATYRRSPEMRQAASRLGYGDDFDDLGKDLPKVARPHETGTPRGTARKSYSHIIHIAIDVVLMTWSYTMPPVSISKLPLVVALLQSPSYPPPPAFLFPSLRHFVLQYPKPYFFSSSRRDILLLS
jgi:hypothetical protein